MKKINVISIAILAISIICSYSTSLCAQPSAQLPDGWTRFEYGTSYSIDVPSTVELRDAMEPYSQALIRLRMNYNQDGLVFQQKGLDRQEKTAFNKYCRIMIQHVPGNYGDYMKATETEDLDSEWKALFDNLVQKNIGPASRLMGNYSYKWATVNDANCIQIDYKRTGSDFDVSIPVICRMAIFQNSSEMVIMTLSYREKEAELWKSDFEKVFNSFKWI